MPNFYAHLRLCREVLKTLPEPLRSHIESELDAYLCGGLGPDPLYFGIQSIHSGRLRRAGLDIHHHTGAAALEPFRESIRRESPYALSFTAGYLLHYLLDARCHPFVKRVDTSGAVHHYALEGEYDRYLIEQDHTTYPEALPHKPMPEAFFSLAAHISPDVTPAQYRMCLRDLRWISLKMARWAGGPVRTMFSAASHLPGAGAIRGMVLDTDPDPKLQRYLLTLDRLREDTARTAGQEILAMYDAARTGVPFSPALGRDYSGNKEEL